MTLLSLPARDLALLRGQQQAVHRHQVTVIRYQTIPGGPREEVGRAEGAAQVSTGAITLNLGGPVTFAGGSAVFDGAPLTFTGDGGTLLDVVRVNDDISDGTLLYRVDHVDSPQLLGVAISYTAYLAAGRPEE